MKKITQFSVKYPVTVLMFICAVFLLGYISFSKLGIDLFPDLNNPKIFIELEAGERPPEEIEKLYVDGLESLAMRQTDVVEVSSVSQVGSARITVEYNWKADMDEAFLELQKVATTFNQSADLDDITITRHDPNSLPVMIVGLSHPQITDMDELRKIAENYIRNELIRLEGIAEVELSGQEEKEVEISTDPYLLKAHELTSENISNKIKNLNRNISGGSIVDLGTKYIIKGVSVFQTLKDIEDVIVAYKQPQQTEFENQDTTSVEKIPVYLTDVAEIKYRNKNPENIVRINGKRCLGLSIFKETKFNTVKAVDELQKSLNSIKKSLPGYEFTVVENQGEYIKESIKEVKQTALIGVFLAVIVLFIFLRRIGTTSVVSLAIPISVVATFNLMYFNGLSLNIMTLGGLALGAGMLVDNAIVVMENIFRNIESGMSVREAAVNGTAEVGGAITASTITTIVVFLPIVYLHGAAGEIFKEQALTVAFALVSSLIVAIFVIPMLTTKLLSKKAEKAAEVSVSFPWYPYLLANILNKRRLVIGLSLLLVICAALLIPVVGSEFVPGTESETFLVEVELPEGTQLERTEQTVLGIEERVKKIFGSACETIYSHIGPSTGLSSGEKTVFTNENTAEIQITITKDQRHRLDELIERLAKTVENIPDLEVRFKKGETALQSILGTDESPIVVEVKGEELGILESLSREVKGKLETFPDLFNIESSFEEGVPELDVKIDRLSAGLYNLPVNQIISQIKSRLSGQEAGQWEDEGELKDIYIRLPDVTVKELEDMVIYAGSQEVRLNEIADIEMSTAPREINRRNQVRIGKIKANIRGDEPFDHVAGKIRKKLETIDFPPDYSFDITGEEQKRNEAMKNLFFALILSIILVYMVLASQFESLVHPFTILLTIPLAGVGSVFIFFILNMSFNIMAFIGIIMLAGIAVNDSIILVDTINKLRSRGVKRHEAVIEAGRRRIRPIIMTSLTTILALLPLTLGFGQSASLRSPLALAVIGGLCTSTLLTLAVIPCVYVTLDMAREKLISRIRTG